MEAVKNRNTAYHNIDNLGKRQFEVLEAIRLNQPCTAQEICRFLGVGINQVTGRISELRDDLMLITEAGSEVNQNSKAQNTLWRHFKNKDERINAINKKYVELQNIKAQLESDGHIALSPYAANVIAKEIEKVDKRIKKIVKL
jgi:hypothetical protein